MKTGRVAVAQVAAPPATADEATGAAAKEPIPFEWLPFPDTAKFKVLGLRWFEQNQPKLWRMPKAQFSTLPKGVQRTSKSPAGARILIKCNTANLGIKVTPAAKGNLKGFDVYINGKFLRSVVAEEPQVEAELVLFRDLGSAPKEIIVYLPYHQDIAIKAIGVDKGTKFSAPTHTYAKPLPIVYYGSSVCQGAGGSKPGMSYEAILGRELNLDFVNLGFGGAGKAEKVVVDLVNSIPACCYIFDLGKSYGMQDLTAYREMLRAVRTSHPKTPIICMTPITSSQEVHSESYSKKSVHTRTVMRDAAKQLIKAGDKRIYLLEGTDLLGFNDHDGLSKDGVHPSDYGFSLIAKRLLPAVKKALAAR